MLVCYLYVWQCLHHKTTKEQVKTCLASTVQVGVQPVSSLAALEVLIGEATVSVANSYNVVLLQQTCNSLVVLKAATCFLAHHKQGASDTFSFLCSCLYFRSLL